MGYVTLTTPLWGWSVILKIGYDIVYLYTKFDHSSSNRSRDMVGAHQNFNVLRDLTFLYSYLAPFLRYSET